MNLFPKKTVSKRSKPLTNLSMISMISLMSLRNLENYSAVNLCTGPTFITAVPVCCPGRVTSWGHWHGEVTSWSLHVVSWGRIGGYRAEPMSHIYIWNIGQTPENQSANQAQSGKIRQSTSININTPIRPVSGLFLLIWWGAGKLCLRYMWSTIASLMQNGRSCTRARGGVWFGPEPSQTHSILARYWLAGCQFSRMFNL